MSRPFTIGITGGIGAGKSVVCKVFQKLGVPVYDADSQARWLMNHSKELKRSIQSLFGEKSFLSGELDRAWVASQAFHHPELLNQLNALVHPAVAADFEEWTIKNASAKYVIKEAALLFETGSYKQLDHVILVTAPVAVRTQRVRLRDSHRSVSDIEAIMNKQMSDVDKMPLADSILVNDGQSLLVPQILQLHEQFSAHVQVTA